MSDEATDQVEAVRTAARQALAQMKAGAFEIPSYADLPEFDRYKAGRRIGAAASAGVAAGEIPKGTCLAEES